MVKHADDVEAIDVDLVLADDDAQIAQLLLDVDADRGAQFLIGPLVARAAVVMMVVIVVMVWLLRIAQSGRVG